VSAPRGGCWGHLVGLAFCLLVVLAFHAFGWPRDRALWLGLGTALGMLTLTRPWWFWEDYRARWLRGLIGDAGTALVYLALAAMMMWIGLETNWRFGRQ